MTRRDLLRLLLASPVAALVDVEQLLWTPKPIITVPRMPLTFHPDAFAMEWPMPERLRDVQTGISIRFVRQYAITADLYPTWHKAEAGPMVIRTCR